MTPDAPARRTTRRAALASAVASLAALLLAACTTPGEALPPAALRATPTPLAGRTDCAEVFGTAFRSFEEQRWYDETCSRWPLVDVPQGDPSAPAEAAAEPDACAAVRGRPYVSEEQRRWFLDNCRGRTAGAQTPPPPPPTGPAPPSAISAGPDRAECNAIRGTAYRSAAERDWFLANCPAGAAASAAIAAVPGGPQGASGPDRADCNAIRGTAYRSAAERDWYQRNCQPPPTQQQRIVIVPGAPSPSQGNSAPSSPTVPPSPTPNREPTPRTSAPADPFRNNAP